MGHASVLANLPVSYRLAKVLPQDNRHRLALLEGQTRGTLGKLVGTGVGLTSLVLSGGVTLAAAGEVLSAGIPLASAAGSALEDMGWQAYGSWQPRLRNTTRGGEPKFESSNTCSGIVGGQQSCLLCWDCAQHRNTPMHLTR